MTKDSGNQSGKLLLSVNSSLMLNLYNLTNRWRLWWENEWQKTLWINLANSCYLSTLLTWSLSLRLFLDSLSSFETVSDLLVSTSTSLRWYVLSSLSSASRRAILLSCFACRGNFIRQNIGMGAKSYKGWLHISIQMCVNKIKIRTDIISINKLLFYKKKHIFNA